MSFRISNNMMSNSVSTSNHDIENIIGYISVEYSCLYNTVMNGTLYGGSDGLYFLSQFFLFEKKVVLKWNDILQVQKSDEGITIVEVVQNSDDDDTETKTNQDKKDKVYHVFTFNNINNHQPIERMWSVLKSLHNDALLDMKNTGDHLCLSPGMEARQLRRTNSDPLLGDHSVRDHHSNTTTSSTAQPPPSTATAVDKDNAINENSNPNNNNNATTTINTTNNKTDENQKENVDQSSNNDQGDQDKKNNKECTDPSNKNQSVGMNTPIKKVENFASKPSNSGGSGNINATPKDYTFAGGDDQFFSLIGEVSNRFPCNYKQFQGTLVAGNLSIGFLGSFLFVPRKIIIHWDDLHQFRVIQSKNQQQASANGNNNNNNNNPSANQLFKQMQQLQRSASGIGTSGGPSGIEIITRDNTSFQFINMDEPDRIWASLVQVQQKVLIEQPSQQHAAVGRAAGHQLQRTNSDPSMAASHRSPVPMRRSNVGGKKKGDEKGDCDHAPTSSSEAEMAEKEDHEMKRIWTNILNKTSSTTECVVNQYDLDNCNLDTFFELFIQNDCKYSISSFLKEQGEQDIDESEWKPIITADGKGNKDEEKKDDDNDVAGSSKKNDNEFSLQRVVYYNHQVNAPLAPPMARARKEQKFKRYGNHGLYIVTETYVDDVPMADCFFVYDRLIVEPKIKKNNMKGKRRSSIKNSGNVTTDNNNKKDISSGVTVRMEFDINFVKSTMFRGVITRTTNSELYKYFSSYADFMSTSSIIINPSSPQQQLLKQGELLSSGGEDNGQIDEKTKKMADSSGTKIETESSRKSLGRGRKGSHHRTSSSSSSSFVGGSYFSSIMNMPRLLFSKTTFLPLTLTMVFFFQGWILLEMREMKQTQTILLQQILEATAAAAANNENKVCMQ